MAERLSAEKDLIIEMDGGFCEHGNAVQMDFMNAKCRPSLHDICLENVVGFLLQTLDDTTTII